MSRQLARNLYHLMRRASRRTPVDRLKRQGHRTVSVLSFRAVEQLIERAIRNTLKRRGLDLDTPEIQEEVRLEFLALMRERDILQQTVDDLLREKDELRRNREALTTALSEATEEFEHEKEAVEHPVETEELDELKARVVERLSAMLGEGENAESAVALVAEAIDEQRATTLLRAREAHATRLRDLERRISKLKRKLQETEDMLMRARTEGAQEYVEGEPIDPGLKAEDPNYNTKKALLGEIFKLNVELREILETP